MKFKIIRFSYLYVTFCLLAVSPINTSMAAPGTLADAPLFTTNSVPPNVFFEVDDSGSMDWEILTKTYWDILSYTSGNDAIGYYVANGLFFSQGTVYFKLFNYIFDNNDDLYGTNCTGNYYSFATLENCNDSAVENFDWRVKSSSLNVMYYNPDTIYDPWQQGDGNEMDSASFTAAKSNPQTGATGNTDTKNLQGIIYNVWSDTHGFSGTQPTSGTINKTDGGNGIVDWWDEHLQFTVNASSIDVNSITYTGVGNVETTTYVTTLNGTGTHSELGDKTIAEVQQNIANWYQYYRRRSFVTKAAIAQVISNKSDYRYGLNFINNSTFSFDGANTTLVEMPSGNGSISYNTKLIDGLFNLTWPALGTPLRQGLKRAGEYFDNNDGRTDPIIEQCQQNFSVLFTDGYWNGSTSPGVGNVDGDSYSNSVADVAKYYYDQDLSTFADNVVGNVFDTATHQHMVTYTVAFGVSGNLIDSDNDGWPEVVVGNDANGDPLNMETGDWGDPFIADSPDKIDDLWHAAFNSKGSFISAETPEDVSQALNDALSNIIDRSGSAASVAFNTTTLTQGSAVYLALFSSSNNKWSGDILSFELDPLTGDVADNPTWQAADVLDALASPTTSRNIFTYNGSTGVPFLWANLTATQQADFKVEPNNTVTTDASKSLARLNFMRGDRSNEDGSGGTYTFRNRSSLLGDTVNSTPVYVGKPILSWPSVDPFPYTIGTNTYSDFKESSAKTREAIIYQGSNDGMLHGFKASDGSEALAYIPTSVFSSSSATSGLHYLTDVDYTHRYYVDMPLTISDVYIDKNSDATLDWYTVLIGGGGAGSKGLFALDITDPSLFVENDTNAASLVLWEFDQTDDSDMGFTFSKPTIAMMNNGRWAAIFGNGYNSTGSGEAVLFIVFIDGGLDGTWTSGTDYLKISTGVGSINASDCSNASSDCNGLSTPQVVDLDGDKIVDRVYAGDLKGNMWVFDVSDSSNNATSNWEVAFESGNGNNAVPAPLFTATYHNTLTDGDPPSQVTTTAQPITDKPILVKHPDGLGGDPDVLVFFGTGQYLIDGDVSNSAVQSFYGVWDNNSSLSTPLTPANLIEQEFLSATFVNDETDVSSQVRVLTDNIIDYANGDKGWMINLTLASGERVIVDPDVRGDLVFFNTWIPETNPCDPGGSGFLMSVKQSNGGRPDEAAFDLNRDGNVDAGDLVSVTTTVDDEEVVTYYAPSGELFDAGLPASSSFLSNKQYTPGTDGEEIDDREVEDLSDSETGRLSWQELRN